MTARSGRPKLHERLVMRALGIRVSRDGSRVTIPRKRAAMLDGVVEHVIAAGWRERADVHVTRSEDLVRIDTPKGSVEVRVV